MNNLEVPKEPPYDTKFWRVQVDSEDEMFVLSADGSSYVLGFRVLSRCLKKIGFSDPNFIINYIWNFKAVRIDLVNKTFGSVTYLDNV